MNNFYIYRYTYEKTNSHDEKYKVHATVIFCHTEDIEMSILKSEIKVFYERHHHADEIYVIGGDYLKKRLIEVFETNQEDSFLHIPKVKREHLKEHTTIMSFNKDGKLSVLNGKAEPTKLFLGGLVNEGMLKIFINRGGLIESEGTHHFVFPSGKHCNKFLRAGNILLHSSEVYFIAFNLLRFFDENNQTQIFCDTSSINTLAFALQELKRRLNKKFKVFPVESFSSYEGLYEKKGGHFSSALILISASTSANILQRILKASQSAKKENIVILFFLGSQNSYVENKERILCNISHSKENPNGIAFYDTYTVQDCVHCKSGSYPVEVVGDVFLLEKPKIHRITIKKDDSPKGLSSFIKEFKSLAKDDQNVFKVNFKENRSIVNKYDFYFDMHLVLENIIQKKEQYKTFQKKLTDYINQYIPSNVKYLIHLNDEGSITLANLIKEQITSNPTIVSQDAMESIIENLDGSAVVVASCIANGKNLLYITRSLRNREKLKIVFFIALTRTKNKEQLDFLKSNLKQGMYGGETNTFVSVYNFYCCNDSLNSNWINEIEFLKKLKHFSEENSLESSVTEEFINKRISLLNESMSVEKCGLANQIFLPNVYKDVELDLRKNFAFFDFHEYVGKISQADVFFTIGSVINELRNSETLKRNLRQSEYVRNVLDPANFNRFNDGVIQAAILRAAYSSELSYSLDNDLSNDMKNILEAMIAYPDSDQGEALLEFLYAIAIGRMSLKEDHLMYIYSLIVSKMTEDKYKNELVGLYAEFIMKEVMKPPKSLTDENRKLLEERNRLLERVKQMEMEIVELKGVQKQVDPQNQ